MIANAGICINRALHESTYFDSSAIMMASHVATATTGQADKLLDINVKGTFYSFKYAALQMIKQGGGGRLVGAASIAGKRGTSYFHP